VALARRDEPHLAVLSGTWLGGGAVVACRPTWTADSSGDLDPFDLLDDAGGWIVGYLGYQTGGLVERLPAPPPRPRPLPHWHLARYDEVLRLDDSGQWWLESTAAEEAEAATEQRVAHFERLLSGPLPHPRPIAVGAFRSTPSGSDHRKAVERALDLIRAGDIYQANVCLRLDARLAEGDPLDLWATAHGELTPGYAAFLDLGSGRAVSSLSPEQFLRRLGREVTTSPIKGTRPRIGGAAHGMRAQLAASEKDRAENVMIVDLMRNDLGRVCLPGSISVPRLFDVEAHPGVWHLVSEVRGRLRPDVGDGGLLRATFPPGSVTGAPKVRAMEIIAEVEASAREVYTGAIGVVSPDSGAEWSVAIRTFEHADDAVWLGVGGGIVAESNPDAELAECLTKAEPLVAALGGSITPVD
jgi:para-aminobenzoate synthetase / 4-amino-4-deoxychorismate lyase